MPKTNTGSRVYPRKRIMRALKINEISAVDVPAQEGAVAVIMKRKDGDPVGAPQTEELVEKRVWLTTSVDGHAHLVDEQTYDGKFREGGDTSWTQSEGEDNGHSHPWVNNLDGTVTIGEADGHSHEVIETTRKRTLSAKERKSLTDLLAKEAGSNEPTKEDEEMPKNEKIEKNEQTVEELQEQLAKANADTERANALATLTDVTKAHFDTLKGDEAEAFLVKSADERQTIVDDLAKQSKDDDPVAYTTTDGVELRKSAGDAMISIAKSNDQLRKDNDELRKERAQESLEKRAENELAHTPGDLATRVSLLKAVDAIEDDDQREASLNALKANDAALSKAFDVAGHGGSPAPGSADDQLDELAKKHQEANPELSIEQAAAAVLKTAEGAELYNKSIN